MLTMYDILNNAQGGEAMRNLARVYGLSPDQTQAAIAALLPAFSLGLKRATETPDGLAQMFQAMVQRPYAEFFENASRLFGGAPAAQPALHPGAVQAGNDILALVFGSENVNRAVAAQAAALSGIGSEVTRAMMPIIASMLVGGMMRMLQQGGPFGQILGQMMGGAAPAPQPAPPMPDFGSILTQWMEAMTGTRHEPEKPAPAGAAFPDLSEMTKQLESAGHLGQHMFGQMLEAGVAVQRTQLDAVQQIFDSLLGAAAPDKPKSGKV